MNANEATRQTIEVDAESRITVNLSTTGDKPVKLVVVHRHIHDKTRAPAQEEASSPLAPGSTVRFLVDATKVARDGSIGTYLGATEQGQLLCDFGKLSPGAVFQIKSRGVSEANAVEQISLVSAVAKYVRVNGKGAVDCLGGGGRWTLFEASPQGSGILLKSVANAGKANVSGGDDWFLGIRSDGETQCLVGDAAPTAWSYEEIQAAPTATRQHVRAQRLACKAERTKAALVSDWVEIAADPKPISKSESESKSKSESESESKLESNSKASKAALKAAKEKGAKMPSAAVPKKISASHEFPQGSISLLPAQFSESQNRKGTTGWHLGCAPMGYLVADASSGSWGTWVVHRVPKTEFLILESSHTPAFHLAISKNGDLTHKGGRGKFAHFAPEKHGRFWCLKNVGTELFIGISSSGVLKACKEAGKETRFLISTVVSSSE